MEVGPGQEVVDVAVLVGLVRGGLVDGPIVVNDKLECQRMDRVSRWRVDVRQWTDQAREEMQESVVADDKWTNGKPGAGVT